MSLLIAILTLALVAFVVLLVSAPLRRSPPAAGIDTGEEPAGAADGAGHPAHGQAQRIEDQRARERDELEAAREAKYREIRDCELDYRTGKLSRADYETIDGQLRAEALAILDRLEAPPLGDLAEEPRRGGCAQESPQEQEP